MSSFIETFSSVSLGQRSETKTSLIRINERHRRQEAHVEDHANPATMPGPSQSYSIWEKFAHPRCYRRRAGNTGDRLAI
ncbi:hypothetical protein BIFPSEUDO_03483 [Bifidobacterium pseudocatenulatum DSM 20438 = JCM 1200 = LMG 10505]|uniref:Uncharacterized protein n=1 Tax=Bifidobacterium pseudocatenulatum DSM 20438 = JCM 1200 = LMG 10505 TaxID=547043 RepID=C0BSW5_BIFPS|nr:hypothetical protein BIFPSEUDO_03483 [Bifidobacterium pseudocatenulatum DSM 20438 = JCM 1200 = LMG 10505]